MREHIDRQNKSRRQMRYRGRNEGRVRITIDGTKLQLKIKSSEEQISQTGIHISWTFVDFCQSIFGDKDKHVPLSPTSFDL